MEKVFKKLSVFFSTLLIITTVFLIFVIPTYIKSERKIDFFSSNQIVDRIKNMEINQTSVIYVKNNKGEWEEYQRLHGTENRLWVEIDNMPQNLIVAFVSIEDERFYSHSGVDWKRTLAAVGNKLLKFDSTEFGGSTITQQLIKNITGDDDKDVMRKFREIIRALLVERKLDKDEIMEAYLNTISLGNGIAGVQVASNYYFNKDVSELTLVECASLAAITKNPSKYNPVAGPEENTERRHTVLDKMLELEKITYEEYDEAYNADIVLDNSQEEDYEAEINNYFVDALIEQAINDLAEKYECSTDIASTMFYNGGFKIYATVNPDIQSEMEKVYQNVDKYFKYTAKDPNGNTQQVQSAMTIMDYEGHIVGLVGGVGEKTVNRGLNRATGAPRQPGSTMKPLGVYALAIENDLVHYTSKVVDKPIENYYPDGRSGPKEWYRYYKGTITLDYAIRKSANTIPVKLLQEIGIDTSYDFLVNKLGCKHLTEEDKNLASLALGGCRYGLTTTESAAAYAIFGNQGVYHEPTTYYKIERANGEVVIDYDETGTQVISPASATIMNHLLQGVVYGSEGTGRGISGYNSMKAYAKTGTSSESNDLWMVAGTPYYVGSVWYGFDYQSEIKSSSAAATVWRDIMRNVHKGLEKKEFEDSDDVYKKGIGYYKECTKPDNTVYSGSGSKNNNSSSKTSSSDTSSTVTSSQVTSSGNASSGGTSSGETSSGGASSGSSSSGSGDTSSGDTSSGDSSSGSSSSGSSSSDSSSSSQPSSSEATG